MNFRVIPVIDIMQGTAVHAVGGHREDYRPLKSTLSVASDPVEVALGLKEQFGFDELYTADLDGITKGEANLPLLSKIFATKDLSVMVDSGVNSPEEAERLLEIGAVKVVIGSETLNSLDSLGRVVDAVGGTSATGSVDVKDGKVLSRCRELVEAKPVKAARILEGCGVGELILLDLSRVGSETGVDAHLVEAIVGAVDLPLLVGGGVSSIDDMRSLRDAGASGVLVTTALHRGLLSRREIDTVRL
ncbi:MAG: HisA/HisF-related TIM barrel protein [Thaumarchaeota archaeon]|nr:HisA/HisF-related TIM barrel protein [Nitrososphaerota archaeon]MCL5318703.1 HisA/HisF-related TIM barrel protein [Nitrososphaerota archaeon]